MCCSTYILEMNSAIVWNMICIQINKISNTLGPCGRGSWLKPCHFLWFQFSVFQKQQIKRRLSTNPQWVFLLIFVPHVQLVFVFSVCFLETLVLRFSFAAHTNAVPVATSLKQADGASIWTVPLVWFAAGRNTDVMDAWGMFNKTHKKNTSDWIWVGLL